MGKTDISFPWSAEEQAEEAPGELGSRVVIAEGGPHRDFLFLSAAFLSRICSRNRGEGSHGGLLA